MNFPLDHIGYAVHSMDDSILFYQNTFGLKLSHREVLTYRSIEIAFLDLENTKIELLAGINDDNSISKFLSTHGPGLHHVCYQVTDIRSELARLKGLGLKLIDETPRPGAHGTEIAFIHPKSCLGVLTELCEYKAMSK